jgi:hypothetical protein
MNFNTGSVKKVFNLLFLIFLLLFCLGQLQRVQLTESIGLYLHDLLIMVWIVLSALFFPHKWLTLFQKSKAACPPVLLALLSWVVLGLGVAIITDSASTTIRLYLARVTAYLLFGTSLLFTTTFTHHLQRQWWTIAGLGIAWLGIAQYLLIPDTRFLWILGWDYHYYRLIGTQLDPGYTGILIVMTIYFLWSIRTLAKPAKIAISIPLVVAVLLSFSRATYLSLAISSLVFAVYKLSRKSQYLVAGLICVGTLSLLLLPKPGGEGVNLLRTFSIVQRLDSNYRAITSLQPYQWVVGKGLFNPVHVNTTPILNQHAQFPDNLLAFLLVGVGVPGLILSLLVLAKLTHLFRRDPYLYSAWIAVLIHSQFNHTLFQPFVLLMIIGGVASLDSKRHF